MRGEIKIRVSNSRNSYSFSLKRNLTVLRGESGRGKTTLFEMIQEYNRFGRNSGVHVSCDREVVAVSGDQWKEEIARHPGSVIVIDEDSRFVRSKEFAETVRGSDHYFLLITREYLAQLPISVDEIYELSGAKNKKFKKIYGEMERIFDRPSKGFLPFRPEVIITEDSGSGYQFFKKLSDKLEIECIAARGKSRILSVMEGYPEKNVVVIADGAAFGSEIGDIVKQQDLRPRKVAIFLPESFEWILLRSGVVPDLDPVRLETPEEFADSVDYMSWEQYFTELLIESTRDSGYRGYSKSSLPEYYLQERVREAVKGSIRGIDLG